MGQSIAVTPKFPMSLLSILSLHELNPIPEIIAAMRPSFGAQNAWSSPCHWAFVGGYHPLKYLEGGGQLSPCLTLGFIVYAHTNSGRLSQKGEMPKYTGIFSLWS